MSFFAHYGGRFTLILASVTLAIVVFEGVARAFNLAPAVLRLDVKEHFVWHENPILGYLNNPAKPEVNSQGLMDIERQVHKPEGRIRIGVIGDSVTTMEDALIHPRIDALLPDHVEVLNFGVSGYNTLMEAELLKVKGVRYDLDLVVLVFTVNDFEGWGGDEDEEIRWDRRRAAEDAPELAKTLFLNSTLFRMVALAFDMYGFQEATDAAAVFREDLLNATEDSPVANGFAVLHNLSAAHDFQLVIVLWPLFNDNGIIFPAETREQVRSLAQPFGIPVFELVPHFAKDYARAKQADSQTETPRHRYTVGDGNHPNPHGADIAAKSIVNIISKLPESDRWMIGPDLMGQDGQERARPLGSP